MVVADLWHQWMTHVHTVRFNEMAAKDMVRGLKQIRGSSFRWMGWGLEKSHKTRYKTTPHRPEYRVEEYFYSNLGGSVDPASVFESKYMLLYVDDFSNFRVASKDVQFKCFQKFDRLIFNKSTGSWMGFAQTEEPSTWTLQWSSTWKVLRYDKEVPGTPQENRKVERENLTIIKAVRTMFYAREVPFICGQKESILRSTFPTELPCYHLRDGISGALDWSEARCKLWQNF